jgi:hypothetical protein
MPPSTAGVTSIAFDPISTILSNEAQAIASAVVFPDERFNHFVYGLDLARRLMLARAEIEYAGLHHVVATILFVKTINDLLSSCLVMRAGYSLQAFPLLRAALETAELIEYLRLRPEGIEDFVTGRMSFQRDLSWVRRELPDSQTRTKAYDALNYLTHSNFKGLNIYTTYNVAAEVTAAQVGPMIPRSPLIIPYIFASAIVGYSTRAIWEYDPAVMDDMWARRLREYNQTMLNFLGEVPSLEDLER